MSLFARIGRGTLAPWDPTRRLVTVGPYRCVRNPMISGVALMLLGQTLWWGSRVLGIWAGTFVMINHTYFILSESRGWRAGLEPATTFTKLTCQVGYHGSGRG